MKDLELKLEEFDIKDVAFNISDEEFHFDVEDVDLNIPYESFDLPDIEINQPNISDEELKQMCLDTYNKITDMLIEDILSWKLSKKETKTIIRGLAKAEWIRVWRAKNWHKGEITDEEKIAFCKILKERWISLNR